MSDPVERDAAAIYADTAFARRYAECLGEFAEPAFYERRAALGLLPPLPGLHLLDAGCGPGVYTEWLARQGAQVTALDGSPAMLALTQARLARPLRKYVRLLQADLSAPLPLDSACFETVLCAMVLQHLRDWAPVLAEFRRVLKPSGCIVLSSTHPFADLEPDADYFEPARLDEAWEDYGVTMPCWRRSFERIFADVAAAGLRVEALSEPRSPSRDPFVNRQPWVLCLRLRPAPA